MVADLSVVIHHLYAANRGNFTTIPGETMPSPYSISAVIPTHGRDDMLAVALSSVLGQTLAPIEVFVVDDLGRESTREYIRGATEHSVIPVVYIDASGLEQKAAGASRNAGAARTTGDVLAFLDDDDYWEPRFLEATSRSLSDGVDFVVAWTSFRRGERTAPGLTMPAGLTVSTGLDRSGLTGSNAIVRADVFRGVNGFDASLRVLNDFDYLRRLLIAGYSYAVVTDRLVTQVSHDLGHLSTRSLSRASVIRNYRDANRTELARNDWRHLSRLMHASSRGVDQNLIGRVWHAILQAVHTSPSEYAAGIDRRIRTGLGMYR